MGHIFDTVERSVLKIMQQSQILDVQTVVHPIQARGIESDGLNLRD